MTTTLRVHFDGSVLVPEEPVDLPVGQSVGVRIEINEGMSGEAGTPAAVLRALRSAPHVSAEDVAVLERSLNNARLPVRQDQLT